LQQHSVLLHHQQQLLLAQGRLRCLSTWMQIT
jgi:hypothetical protein